MTYPEYDPNQAYTQADPYPGAGAPGYNEQNPYQYPPQAPQQPPPATYPAPVSGYPAQPVSGYPAPVSGYPAQQAYPPAPGYPAPGYAPVYAQSASTNTMAILSLIFAFVVAPLGIVFGHMAKKQIRNTGEQGEGLATAGLILGYIFTSLYVLFCAFYVIVLVFIGTAATTTGVN
jgi:hypothetical protein